MKKMLQSIYRRYRKKSHEYTFSQLGTLIWTYWSIGTTVTALTKKDTLIYLIVLPLYFHQLIPVNWHFFKIQN